MSDKRLCGPGAETGRAYCGRRSTEVVDWDAVTCDDCLAARRADEEADRDA
jgi:hypothetical protein